MNDKEITYFIGDLAKKLGLSQRTIRYYEELGLINPKRTDGGFRTYSDSEANLIRMIIRFKDLGMTLDEVRALISPSASAETSTTMENIVDALRARRKDFEIKLKNYKESIHQIDCVLDLLSKCATCGEPGVNMMCKNCLREHEERGERITTLFSSLFGGKEKGTKG